jgi:hypothetical protein
LCREAVTDVSENLGISLHATQRYPQYLVIEDRPNIANAGVLSPNHPASTKTPIPCCLIKPAGGRR